MVATKKKTADNDLSVSDSTRLSKINLDSRVLAYIAMAIAVIFGFRSLEQANMRSDAASETARNLAVEVARQTDQREQERFATELAGCQLRNTAQRNSRDRFVRLFENLDEIVPEGTRQAENLERLKEGIDLDPTHEDRDCDADGLLTDADYVPIDQQGPVAGVREADGSSPTTTTTTTTSRLGRGGVEVLSNQLASSTTSDSSTTSTTGVRRDPSVTPPAPPLAPPLIPLPEEIDPVRPLIEPVCDITDILALC